MKFLGIIALCVGLAACDAHEIPSPQPSPNLSGETVLRSESTSPTSIQVIGHTSRDGQILNPGTSQCYTETLNHTHRDNTGQYVPVTHTLYKFCVTSGPTPYNGGWINVYAVHDEGEEYLTQVPASMKYVTVNSNTLTRNFRLEAFASGYQEQSNGDRYNCAFDLFGGYAYGQSNITVPNSGTYEAYFSCVTAP